VKEHRKCDTTKYRRRRAKERENTATARKERRLRHLAEAAKVPARPTCPLCGYPITVDDALLNMKRISLNHVLLQVHKICPTEVNK
jgi:hypothetical protein